MNNFMKKALCLILAVIMVCVPVAVGAENVDEAIDVGENYVFYGTYLQVGELEYEMSELYEYTVFAFAPTEKGKYTFTVDGTVGIVSYNAMWITVQPSETTVTDSSLSWECTGVGQEIWVAVKSNSSPAVIKVESAASDRVEIAKIIYENKTTPAAFTFTGDKGALLSVNTLDSVVDEAVLGADGYYHLNDAKGPVLYANLNDSQMSLNAASGYGQLKGSDYDENGNLIAITDYNTAFAEYFECADASTYLYPLTDDLMEMFIEVGANQSWYGATGWVGGTKDDAWMFACYYNELPEIVYTPGDVNNDGSINSIDSNSLKRIIVGALTVEAGSAEALAADVDGSGSVNGQDTNALKRMISVGA